MTETIKRQIFAIRESGITNMFDIPAVLHTADELGFEELVDYLRGHRREYAHFILTGEEE